MSGRLKIKLFGLITFINVAIGVTLGGLLYTIGLTIILNGIHLYHFFIGSWH